MSDRRLQAVYDALDVGNYKQVLKLCDAALKKGDGEIIEALKAMALLRTGKPAEARALALDARRGICAPIDDGLVHALSLFHRACGDLPAVRDVCDEAFKCEPHNEVAGTQLFYAVVRLFDFSRQQAVAMRLQRQFPPRQREFAMWALTSLLLQARPGGGAEPALAPKLVQLATMMMGKAGGPRTVSELRLALAIAQAHGEVAAARAADAARAGANVEQRAHADAAAREADAESARRVLALLGAHADLLATLGGERAELEATCAARLGDGASALDLREAALLQGRGEDWGQLCTYIDAALPTPHELRGRAGAAEALGAASRPPPPRAPLLSGGAEVAAGCARVERLLAALQASQPRARAPMLGRIALCWKRLALAPADDAAALEGLREGACAQLLLYFEAHGDRPCCAEDTRPYLHLLAHHAAQRERLCAGAEARCGAEGQPGANARRAALQRRTCAARWRAAVGCGAALSRADRLGRAAALAAEYGDALELGDACEKTELQPADGLLLCAASLLQGDACPLRQLAQLIAAPAHRTPGAGGGAGWRPAAVEARAALSVALALEEGTAHSRANFQLRLRLLVAYSALGAAECARAQFAALGTRKLQLESLQYAVLPQLFALGNAREARLLCAQTRAWYAEAARELSESSVLPYRHGNCAQALDFEAFRCRLRDSQWRVHSGLVGAMLALSAAPADVPAALDALAALELAPRVEAARGLGRFVSSLACNFDGGVFESLGPERADETLRLASAHWLRAHAALALALEAALRALLPPAATPPAASAASSAPAAAAGADGAAPLAGDVEAAERAAADWAAQLEAAQHASDPRDAAPEQPSAFPPCMAHSALGLLAMRAAHTAVRLSRAARARAEQAGSGEAHAAAELAAELRERLARWAEAAEAACSRSAACLCAAPAQGAAWSELCEPRALDELRSAQPLGRAAHQLSLGPAAEDAAEQPPLDAHAISECAELALVQLPSSCLLLHAAAAALARALPKAAKRGQAAGAEPAPDEAAQLGAGCRAAVREAALRAAGSADSLARALAPLATGGPALQCGSESGEAGAPQEPLPLNVLPFADYILHGTARAAGAQAAREQMAERLRASYADSASQLRQRLLELAAVLRQVR